MAMTILKNGPIHAVVAFVNHQSGSTDVLDLDALVLAGTQTAQTPRVNIKAVHYSVHSNGHISVTRNSTLLWDLSYAGVIKGEGWTDARENTSDISVEITGGGTLILELTKVSGFGDGQHINAV